jgi:hypothetical protein
MAFSARVRVELIGDPLRKMGIPFKSNVILSGSKGTPL